jgi:type VI secretion system protein ImpH
MTVAFMGLTGPQGVLPGHYSELVIETDYEGDRALADFLDLFNHRLISIFYRAWEKHHFYIGFAREARGSIGADRFAAYLSSLIGMGTPHLTGRTCVHDHSLLAYAGLITQKPHSASALRGILGDHFDLPVETEQLLGKWYPLEDSSLSWLRSSGVHNQLGFGAIAGDAVWNQQALFRVRIGPMGLGRFIDLLPDGKSFLELVALTRFFVGDSLEFDVQVILAKSEVPHCRLTDESRDAARLGWMSWLKTDEFRDDAADAVFQGEQFGRRAEMSDSM